MKENKRGNDLAAQKSRDDQWWDTLKWTYTEAKDSQSAGSTFRTVAAAKILDSLNDDRGQLTPQQKRAVESILDMFAESAEPEVQDAVAPIYQSMGQISARQLEDNVFDAIALMGLTAYTVDLDNSSHFANQNAAWDAVLVAPNKNEVIIEVSPFRNFSRVYRRKIDQLAEYVNENQNRWAVLVTDKGITPQQYELIRAKSSRISLVAWESPRAAKELEHILNGRLEAIPF